MIKTTIQGGDLGDTERHSVRVTQNGALVTTQETQPPPQIGETNKQQYLFGLLGSSGLDSGTTNQNVDGSITPQTFIIQASPDYDIHIIQITAIIADSAVVHNKFGNITALNNGWDIKLTESGIETFIINKAKTGGQSIAQSGFGRPFGDAATSYELINWTGTEDAQAVTIPIGDFIPNGLRIGRGTTDKLESIVNDDLTGLTQFNVYIYGYKNIAVGN